MRSPLCRRPCMYPTGEVGIYHGRKGGALTPPPIVSQFLAASHMLFWKWYACAFLEVPLHFHCTYVGFLSLVLFPCGNKLKVIDMPLTWTAWRLYCGSCTGVAMLLHWHLWWMRNALNNKCIWHLESMNFDAFLHILGVIFGLSRTALTIPKPWPVSMKFLQA